MTELLRDPIWNGVAGVIAIIAFVLAIRKEKVDLISLTQRSIIVMSRALIGVLILLPGVPLQYSMIKIFDGGIPLLQSSWQTVISQIGLSGLISISLSITSFSGFVSAIIASTGKTLRQSIQRSIISVIITLSVTDIYSFISHNSNEIGYLVTSIIFNIVGGFIVGPIIAYGVKIVDTAFSQSIPAKTTG